MENEAVASAGSSDAGAEGHKKRKPRSFCAALTGLTGVMLKQLLRNAQDTRALSGVVYDTYIVSSQWSAVISPKAQTLAYNESSATERSRPWAVTSAYLGLGRSVSRARRGRDAVGRVADTAVGSLGRTEHKVDRGQVQDGQALSSRHNCPANAVQSPARSGGAVSTFGGGKVAGNAAGRKKARTGSSDGTGTSAPRLVGGHEVKGAILARELMLETSQILAARSVDPRSE